MTLQCATATSRNSAKQDLSKDIEDVERYMKEMVVEAKDTFNLSSKKGLRDFTGT